MLAANAVESATAALRGDVAHFRNDVATSALRLVNAVQSSPTNTPALAAAANKAWSVLTTDWEQTQQAWVQFGFAVLGAYQQAILTELAGMGIRLPGQAQSPAPAADTPSGANSTVGSTSQAPGSGATGSGSQIHRGVARLPIITASVPLVVMPDDSNLCNCGCPGQAGSLVQNGSSTSAQDAERKSINPIASGPGGIRQDAQVKDPPKPRMFSSDPVRYADGVVNIAQTDLHSDGFGFPWGQTRSWTNGPGYAAGSDNGNGWVDTYTPHLIEDNGSTSTLIFIANGNTAFYYDLVNGAYQPRINDGSQLNYDSTNDTYTLIDAQGDQIVLDGFGSSWLTAQQGQFAQFTSPGGETMAVTSYTSDGHIAETQRSATSNGNTTIESWLYSYLPSTDPNAGLLSGVTERTQVNGGAWNIVQQVQYTYYDGTQTSGQTHYSFSTLRLLFEDFLQKSDI
jgi:hypothetical protein